MNENRDAASVRLTRREMIVGTAVAAGTAFSGLSCIESSADRAERQPSSTPHKLVKAFCIDFNWGAKGPAEPGLFAQADPEEHVRWYQDLGCNTIQTFCVSYNGYAWYPSEVAPVTPGLKCPDFLGRMVELGRRAGMRVMGYFCLGSNAYWEDRHPNMAHIEDRGSVNVPFTLEYLDYFCRSVEDAMKKTDVDGFMIDWIRPTRHVKWLDCEKEMYRQLIGEKFPDDGPPSAEAVGEFDRRAIERAWRHIRWIVRATRPAIVWTNHPFLKEEYPLWEGQPLLTEADWILNESHELEHLDWLTSRVGPRTLIVQNLCGWKEHNASMWARVDRTKFGFYGFARADDKTTLPDMKLDWNAQNIGILRQAYHEM